MYTAPYDIYTDQRYFDRELSRLFSRTWTFGCTWPEIEKTASFVVANTPMGEVIITNRGGNPQAFYNKCLHRGHRLTDKKRGLTATFACPYHGWQYDGSGKLLQIPGEQKFYGSSAKNFTSTTGIQRIHSKRIGDLIFINFCSQPQPVEAQFNQVVIDGLELTRDKISTSGISLQVELPFNWKLIFENLRDGLHPLFLHKTSLTKEVHFSFTNDFKEPAEIQSLTLTDLSSFGRDGTTKSGNAPHKAEFELVDDGNNYLNWILFPYTHIASPDGGALIGIENYVPITPRLTRFELSLHITKSLGSASPIPILKRWLDKALVVFKEDFDAVISVQNNANVSQMTQNLGSYESMNVAVHNWFEANVYD